jgi:hypothetical protein
MNDALSERMRVALSGTQGVVREQQHEAGQSFTIRRVDAGKLVLPSGRICVADAFNPDVFPPLNRIVPPGEYPVQIVIAELPRNLPFGNPRGAFLMVKFSEAQANSWEPATAVSAADPCFADDDPNGFVQEGYSAVFSPEAGAVHFARVQEQFEEHEKLVEGLQERIGHCDWCNYRPGKDSANVIVCSGGFGDGRYHCYNGVDAAGRVTHLVIDFEIAGPKSFFRKIPPQ